MELGEGRGEGEGEEGENRASKPTWNLPSKLGGAGGVAGGVAGVGGEGEVDLIPYDLGRVLPKRS